MVDILTFQVNVKGLPFKYVMSYNAAGDTKRGLLFPFYTDTGSLFC